MCYGHLHVFSRGSNHSESTDAPAIRTISQDSDAWLRICTGQDDCRAPNNTTNDYQVASYIGRLDVSLEVGALAGNGAEAFISRLGVLRMGSVKLAPIVAPLIGGSVGGSTQTMVTGGAPSPSVAVHGAVGGLLGEFATGLFPGTSASGVAGAVDAAFGFAW